MNILQEIFTDYYEEIKYTLHPRDTEMENIDKMINCGDPSFGGTMYGCPHCGKLKFVPFRCHSRFCPTCGNKYAMEFIQRLIRHIPEKHFKMIRYGGLYARHGDIDTKLNRAVSQEKHHIYRSFTMKPDIEELRKKYIENPPEGMTSKDIRHMSEDELLDMDYFLNDDELDDDFGKEGFYIF